MIGSGVITGLAAIGMAIYFAFLALVLAFLKGATDQSMVEGAQMTPRKPRKVKQPPAWMALHTEAEQAVMRHWVGVHTEDEHCATRCLVHNPSQGPHRDMHPHWRTDRGIMERICSHGVGHPDPDQWYWWAVTGQRWQEVHGCDGCCGGFRHE